MSSGDSTTPTTVEYRLVGNDPGYRVGDDGLVWSCLELSGPPGSPFLPGSIWKRLALKRRKGSLRVNIRKKWRRLHHVVLEAFVGPRPPGMEGCHNDGDFTNNRPRNLRWDTHKSNGEDMIAHGKSTRGEKNTQSKLTAADVRSIRSEYARGGISLTELGRRHGVSQPCISLIVHRKIWKHLD